MIIILTAILQWVNLVHFIVITIDISILRISLIVSISYFDVINLPVFAA